MSFAMANQNQGCYWCTAREATHKLILLRSSIGRDIHIWTPLPGLALLSSIQSFVSQAICM